MTNKFEVLQKNPQRDVSQVQVYLNVTELSQNFDYNINLSSDAPIHPPREYVKVINPPKRLYQSLRSFYIRLENNLLYVHIDQFTLTFKIRYLQFTQSCTKLTVATPGPS